uniref:Uncharacterized protein n=1 Tax=Trichuris muris TaxID=70415 RepID=A0A5S6QZX3_TRIMR
MFLAPLSDCLCPAAHIGGLWSGAQLGILTNKDVLDIVEQKVNIDTRIAKGEGGWSAPKRVHQHCLLAIGLLIIRRREVYLAVEAVGPLLTIDLKYTGLLCQTMKQSTERTMRGRPQERQDRSESGLVSGHLANLPTMVKRWIEPLNGGRGLTVSSWT